MSLPTYSTGTASVAAGGSVVTGVGCIWSGINAKQGDWIVIGGFAACLITEVTDTTHLKIPPWPGAAQTNVAYTIYQNYVGRVVGVAAAEDVADMLERLRDQGPIYNVPPDETEPDPSYGSDGQWAYQITTNTWWQKIGGVWVEGPPPMVPTTAFFVADTPPAGAPDNALWWESDTGVLYIRYNDGTSTQWVVAIPTSNFSEPPNDNVYYARRNSSWQASVGEAASDGNYYARRNGSWQVSPPFPESPNDSLTYGRRTTSGTGAWRRAVDLAGDTMTGQLTVNYGGSVAQSITGNAALADTNIANYGYAAVLGNPNSSQYAGSNFRAKVRAGVAGFGTFNHVSDLTYMIAGIYGWVPTGGHGSAALAGLFDRPDGFGHSAGDPYSVGFCGGVNGNFTVAAGLYDWTLAAYSWYVMPDGRSFGQTAPARSNNQQLATTAYVDATTREKLTADRNYYIAPGAAASDANSGLAYPAGTAGKSGPVTFTGGSANIGFTGHSLSVNDVVYFTTTGQLPTKTNTITFNAGSANINWTGHTLAIGDVVYFTGTGPPNPFVLNVGYYVVSNAANIITVSASPGGTAMVAASAGTGPFNGFLVQLQAQRPYYVVSSAANVITVSPTQGGAAMVMGGTFSGTHTCQAVQPKATGQNAIDTACALDASIYSVYLWFADGTYAPGGLTLKSFLGAGTYALKGNPLIPANCAFSGAGNCFLMTNVVGQWWIDGWQTATTNGTGIFVIGAPSYVVCFNIRHGACATAHFRVWNQANVGVSGMQTIIGDATMHVECDSFSYFNNQFNINNPMVGTRAFSTAMYKIYNGSGAKITGTTYTQVGGTVPTTPKWFADVVSWIAGGAAAIPGTGSTTTTNGSVVT